jgi:hypothetical protein
MIFLFVIPADFKRPPKARRLAKGGRESNWIPAFAGMTKDYFFKSSLKTYLKMPPCR